MTRVYLSIGSNIEPRQHVAVALDALADAFGDLVLSSVYESEAVGFDGDNFLNMVAGIDTDLAVLDLSRFLKQLEQTHGRSHQGPRFSARTLDVDILTVGDQVGEFAGVKLPRGEILKNAFVLQPLAEIAGARAASADRSELCRALAKL